MLEETSCVRDLDRSERCAHRLHQSLRTTSRSFAPEPFDLREGLFERTEIRRVGKVQELARSLLFDLFDSLCFVCARVVHHHDLRETESGVLKITRTYRASRLADLRECGSIEVLSLTEKLKGDRSDYEERLPMSSPSGYAKLPDYNRGEPGYKLQRPF